MVSLGRIGDVEVVLGAINSADNVYFSVYLKGAHYGGVVGNEKHNVLIISPNTPSTVKSGYAGAVGFNVEGKTEEWLAVDADDLDLQLRIHRVPGLEGKTEPKIISKGTYGTIQRELNELGLEIPDWKEVETHVANYLTDKFRDTIEIWNMVREK